MGFASRIDACLWMLNAGELSKAGGRAVSEAGWADVDTLRQLLLDLLDRAASALQLDLGVSVVGSAADLVAAVASGVVDMARLDLDHKVEVVLVTKVGVVDLGVVAMAANLMG
jgi:hypothetical protein